MYHSPHAFVSVIVSECVFAESGGAFVVVLIPLIIAYVAYQITVFPKHLAEKVSTKVVEELSAKYSEMNSQVLEPLITQIFDSFLSVIVQPLTQDSAVQNSLTEFLTEFRKTP